MDSVSQGATSAGSGAAAGAAAGSAFGPWGTVIGAGIGALGSLGASAMSSGGGTSAASQLEMLSEYYKINKHGFSWAQLENEVALQAYKKQLAASAAADLALSKQMNSQLPSAQVQGLRNAGLNPILAVLGSGFSPIQSSASASMNGGAHVPSNLSKSNRHINTAGSAQDFAKIFGGAIDAQIEASKADTESKKADVANKEALTSNVKTSNDLVRAQAEKTYAEADLLRDKVQHGSSVWSDFGREFRSGLSSLVDFFRLVPGAFDGASKSQVEPNGNSAKHPGITIQVKPDNRPYWRDFNKDYNWKGE